MEIQDDRIFGRLLLLIWKHLTTIKIQEQFITQLDLIEMEMTRAMITYDAAGFDATGYHKNGTLYDNAGFDYTGYHKNGTLYDSNGYDRYGNSDPGAGGSDPTWDTKPTFDSSYTTSDSINITATASSSPVTNGITYDDNDTLPSGVDIDATGNITGTPDTAG